MSNVTANQRGTARGGRDWVGGGGAGRDISSKNRKRQLRGKAESENRQLPKSKRNHRLATLFVCTKDPLTCAEGPLVYNKQSNVVYVFFLSPGNLIHFAVPECHSQCRTSVLHNRMRIPAFDERKSRIQAAFKQMQMQP